MAAIVRLKRRRQDDAAESLLVSSKRSKSDSNTDNTLTSVFKFAGTVLNESGAVTNTVREAIKKEKLKNSYKLHQQAFGRRPECRRRQRAAAATKSRCSLISSKRAVDLEGLEKDLLKEEEESRREDRGEGGKSDEAGNDLVDGHDKPVWFYDVIPEGLDAKLAAQLPVRNEVITCNDAPMVAEATPLTNKEQDYVFDIYYTNSSQIDFKTFENILAIETISEENEFIYGNGSDEDEVYDDEDDENDECNWRNDYPDEDTERHWLPHSEYSYGYGHEDELVEQLHDALDLRGAGDGASSSDEDHTTSHKGSDSWNPATNYIHYKAQMEQDYHRHNSSGD